MSRNPLALALLLLLFAPMLCGTAAADEDRIWTDKSGRTLRGSYVRLNGSAVVLQAPGNKITQVAIADLSEADREFLKLRLAKDGFRTFTNDQGKQIYAQFLRVRDGTVFVKLDGNPLSFPFTGLSAADRRSLRASMSEADRAAHLPPPDAGEELAEARMWQDKDGAQALGQLDRLLPDGRVLLAVDGATRVVEIAKLTADDHAYLRQRYADTALAAIVPAAPPPPPERVAVTTPPQPPVQTPPPAVAPPNAVASLPRNPAMPPVEPYIPPTRRDYYQRPELNYQPPPPRETRIQEPLRCDKCNREAPPGAKEGELCTYCNAGVTLNKVTDSVMTGYRVIRGIILLFTVMALIGSAWAWCKTKLGF